MFGSNNSVGVPFSAQSANDIFAQFFGNNGINLQMNMNTTGESVQTNTVISGNKKITTRIINRNGQITKEVTEEIVNNNSNVSNFNFHFSF